ncbi:MAG: hypothetical protein O2963_02995 [Proteobacteria bacterium]|jgi:predicted metal-dependent enzyme (double-stranded beta helix superfamily)|nr:hypothetical protein [Pseudomonadota bacterium]
MTNMPDLGSVVKQLIIDVKKLSQRSDIAAIKQKLEKAIRDPTAIIEAMPKFDCEEVLLYSDEEITAYYIATPPGILYPPHEHGMIAISALYKGSETHVFYERDGKNVKEKSRVTVNAPAVVDLDIDAVHAICTDDKVPNEGIHFYLGDLENQTRTLWNISGDNPRQYDHDDYLKSSKPMQ